MCYYIGCNIGGIGLIMTDKQKRMYQAVTATAVVFLLFLVFYLIYQLLAINHRNNLNRKLETQIAQLEKQKEELDGEISYRSSVWYIEKYARENLGLSKKNEKIYIVED